MLNLNKRTVIPAVLFMMFLVPLVLTSCRTNGRSDNKTATVAQAPIAPDSSNLLDLGKLIRENPKSPGLFAKRAELYAQRKNYSQALNDITIALKMDSLNPGYFISQAEYYIFSGEPNSAKKGLNACLKRFPDNTDVLLKMAEIHLYLKEYGKAKLLLKQVMPINDELAQTFFLQGVIASETGDTVGAIRNFEIAIEKDPVYYAAYIQAGKIYSLQGNPLAIQYFKSAADLQPNMYEAHYLLGLFYQEHSFLEEAHQEYEYIISNIDSTRADPYYNRGYIEMVYKGNYEEAAKWFGKALYWKPDLTTAWYNRGLSYELDGKMAKAKSDYQKALELEPNYPLAIKGLNRIEDGKPLKNKR